ncbi:MAG TPA: hypothetical protein VE755_09630 [Myxococcales bacterium]|jgi:hypothetical protein|nr:hypothetical protein [Myxococcales bacterium]
MRARAPCTAVFLALVLFAACGGSEKSGGTTGDESSSSSSGCDGYAEGDYKCDYTGSYSYNVCHNGSWKYAGACTCSVSVGDPRKPPYASTCKSHGTGNIECSYAFSTCLICDESGCH